MSDFKHQLNDILAHKAQVLPWIESEPARLFVIERTATHFGGGVQRHYFCRRVNAVTSLIEGPLVQFNEEELMPYPSREDLEQERSRRWPLGGVVRKGKE